MEASWRCAQPLALLPIYMVAGSYWCPTLLAGGLRVDLRASGLSIAFAMTDATKPTAGGFPLLPGERLEAQQAMEWIRAAKTQLTPDQAALIAGQEPRSAIKYRHSHVLPPLVAGAAGGITQNAVESRDALIQAANDANALKTLERDALISELQHSFFIAIEIAVEPNAPLLLRRMKRECAQAAPRSLDQLERCGLGSRVPRGDRLAAG